MEEGIVTLTMNVEGKFDLDILEEWIVESLKRYNLKVEVKDISLEE